MDFKSIKKFIELAKQEGVAQLKYETDDVKIAVNFSTGDNISVAHTSQIAHPKEQSSLQIQPVGESIRESIGKSIDDQLHSITSPFVGTFYASASPGKPAYVNVGDKVTKGQTLCILEAMKIMNEIESDISGEIVEVCIDNESLVEFGQTLFKVRA